MTKQTLARLEKEIIVWVRMGLTPWQIYYDFLHAPENENEEEYKENIKIVYKKWRWAKDCLVREARENKTQKTEDGWTKL